jgi:hypothetical protein
MSGLTGWLRSLRARWSGSRGRKREQEARKAYAQQGSDPNPGAHRRHGESFRDDPRSGGGI